MSSKLLIFIISLSFLLLGCNAKENCSSLASPLERDSCFWDLAVSTQNPALCDSLLSEQSKKQCRTQTYKFIKNLELSNCEGISDYYRNECIAQVAFLKEDISICEKGVSPYPDLTNDDYHNQCLLILAPLLKDKSICENFDKRSFKSSCYNDVAIATNSVDLCLKAGHQTTQGNCITEVSINVKDVDLCAKHNVPSNCIGAHARLNDDPSVCLNIDGDTFYGEIEQARCISVFVEERKDISLCKLIKNVEFRTQCESIKK